MAALSSGLCRPGIILYLALVILAARSTHSAPVYETDSTQVAEYEGGASGCYYNFQHYQEGARIITNEPCLNCTCHNRMLMCYLRVCPFSKAIGQDCQVEKRPDQCCPVITCPDLPVQLLTSTTSSPSKNGLASSASSTELGFPDSYGCNVNDKFFADGAQLPVDANNPCELCYCIRNKTTCLMQQCTLSVAGCRPVYQPGICCPVKYNCEYDEETLAATTPGLIMTTTMAPRTAAPQCHHEGKMYEDGELIYTIQPCQHCYCFHGEIACAVQDCGKPMESHGKNCTALPPLDGECCPTTYQCEDDFGNIATEIPEIVDKKDATEQPEVIDQGEDDHKKETFPGADNAIPEEIVTTTEKQQTVTQLGNQVPESEPTKASVTGAPAAEDVGSTIAPQPEIKPVEPDDHSDATPTELTSATMVDEASEKPTESEVVVPQATEEPDKLPAEASSDLPPRIGGGDVEDEEDKKVSTEPSLAPDDTTQSKTSPEEEVTPSSLDEGAPTEPDVIVDKAETTGEPQVDDNASSPGQDELTSAISTEREPAETQPSSTASSITEEDIVNTTPSEVVPTEKTDEPTAPVDEATQKSSENSSPVIETMTEGDVSKDATEPTLSSSSTEAAKAAVDTEKTDLSTEMDQLSTIKPATESTEGKEDETMAPAQEAVTDSSEADKPKETVPESITTEGSTGSSIDEESDKPVEPIATDAPSAVSPGEDESPEGSHDEVTPETPMVTASDEESKPKDAAAEITPEGSTSPSVDEESDKTVEPTASDAPSAVSPSEDEKPEGSDDEVTPESMAVTTSDEESKPKDAAAEITPEGSTSSSIDEESDKTVEPTATDDAPSAVSPGEDEKPEGSDDEATPVSPTVTASDEEKQPTEQESSTPEELLSPSTPSAIDGSSVKLGTDETSPESPMGSTTEDNVEEPKAPEQGPTGIPIPDRVPGHKAEDNDAVTDSAVTEGYQATGSGIPHKVDSLYTEAPESGPTTYLPPVGSSTEERQPSTPLYEDLPKQDDVEGQTTELSITPKAPSDKTTAGAPGEVSPIDDESENMKGPSETTTDMPPIQQPIEVEMTSVETFSPEVSSTSYPQTDKDTDVDNAESPTKEPSVVDEATPSAVSTEKPLFKKDDEDEVIPEVSEGSVTEESTTVSGQEKDHTLSTSDVEKSVDEKTQETKLPEPTKNTAVDISTPEMIDSTGKPEDSVASQSTEKPNEPESTDEFIAMSTPAVSSEEPESGSDVEHATDMLASSTESAAGEEKSVDTTTTETDKPVSPEETSEANIVPSKENVENATTDSVSQPIDKTQPFSDQTTEEDKEEKPTEASVETGDQTSSTISTKLNDQETPKEIPTTETTIENKPFEDKSDTSEPPAPESVTAASPVTGSATDELMSTVDISGESTEDQSGIEGDSSHSTEATVSSSQTPSEERPSGIPGEGNCLVDGQSYTNNSIIPSPDSCHLNCRCISSQVNCEKVQCSPPPANVPNCTPVFEPNTCCPMYTCESTPSVQPEADNQMSDHHTPTSSDENLTPTTQKVADESTDVAETTPGKDETEPEITTPSIKSEPESTPEEPESGKENVPTLPSVDEEISSSVVPESTSISTESKISVEDTDKQPSVPEDDKSTADVENLSTVTPKTPESEGDIVTESTPSVQTSSTEATEKDENTLPDEEHITLAPEDNVSAQSTERTDESPKPEDIMPDSLEPSPSPEDLETNVPDQDLPTTPSSKSTESEFEKAAPTEPGQKVETTEIPQDTVQPDQDVIETVSPVEPVDSETQKPASESDNALTSSPPSGEPELTSANTSESTMPSAEDQTQKPREPEIEKEPTFTEASPSSSSETPAKPSATKSTISEASTESDSQTQKPEVSDVEPELTVPSVEEASKTSVTFTEPTTTGEEAKIPEDSITTEGTLTDKPEDTSEVTSSVESSSSIPSVSTEADLTVPAVVDTEDEQGTSSEPTVTDIPEEAAPKAPSDDVTAPHEPELMDVNEHVTEQEQSSSEAPSTASSSDESTSEAKPLDENKPDETAIEAQPEPETTEPGDVVTVKNVEEPDMGIEKATEKPEEKIPEEEKPKQVTTEGTDEATSEAQTVSEETITLSTPTGEVEHDVKETSTASSIETEKETPEPTVELTSAPTIDSKISGETEASTAPEASTEASKVEESSTPIYVKPTDDDQKSSAPGETSTEAFVTKDKIDEPEEATSGKPDEQFSSHEEATTVEPTKVEAYPDEETSHAPSESPDKELMSTVVDSSEETSTEAEKKDLTTEAAFSETSSSEPTVSEKTDEKEPTAPSVSEVTTSSDTGSSTSEVSPTASIDVQDQSTKTAIATGEQSSEQPEAITPEDEQYPVDQQTDEPAAPGVHDEEEQKPVEDHTSTIHPETMKPHSRPDFPDQQMPETDDASIFPPDGADIKDPFNSDDAEPETDDYDDQAVYGPGTCRYGGKIYMSAQQIPRDDACDFCFCFRSDIICLQQSCPPPIPGCHEEPIGGFCCPRYECPVSMATSLNITTTTTTTTTTVPPHFLSHAYKGSAVRGGCQIGNKAYRVGEDIKSKSGPCMNCTCGGDGKMKCEPKACSASPMLKEMIAHAAAKKRRR